MMARAPWPPGWTHTRCANQPASISHLKSISHNLLAGQDGNSPAVVVVVVVVSLRRADDRAQTTSSSGRTHGPPSPPPSPPIPSHTLLSSSSLPSVHRARSRHEQQHRRQFVNSSVTMLISGARAHTTLAV